ncbi:MAG: hypothetical protein V1661_00170 [bacterium]
MKKPDSDCETCKLLFVLAHQGKNNQKKLLKEVNSKLATAVGGDEWSAALECMEAEKKSELTAKCRHHYYRAMRKPGWKCDACWLLFVLKYQMHAEGEKRLGPFNPYYYVIDHADLKKACANLKLSRK